MTPWPSMSGRLRQGRTTWCPGGARQRAAAPPRASPGKTSGPCEPARDRPYGRLQVDPEKCTRCAFAWKTALQGLGDGRRSGPVRSRSTSASAATTAWWYARGAISILEPTTSPRVLRQRSRPYPARMPLEPLDAEGNPAQWTGVEQLIFQRRSVRNFKRDPVPSH